MTRRSTQYMPLSEIKPSPKNPKTHDLGALHMSIDRFGYTESFIWDERKGCLVAGHGRLEVLQQKKKAGEEPPDGIVLKKGEWLAPVQRGWASKSDADHHAYLVASNRLVELGGWDEVALAELLKDLAKQDALDGSGYDRDDLDEILASLTDFKPEESPPSDPPDDSNLYVEPGDIWVCGKHRIVCGDSTDPETIEKLLAAEKPNVMVTDPPYGVEYDPEWRAEAAAKGLDGFSPSRLEKVSNDDRSSWLDAWKLFPGAVVYIWHASLRGHELLSELDEAGFEPRSQIIWAKASFAISRGHYNWQYESCIYAVRKGKTAGWIGTPSETTVWPITSVGMHGETNDQETSHGTQKPLECMGRPIRNHAGDVYDPFLGSGTTLIAAEQLGRRCFAAEIEPRYVQMAINRWEAVTGEKADRTEKI